MHLKPIPISLTPIHAKLPKAYDRNPIFCIQRFALKHIFSNQFVISIFNITKHPNYVTSQIGIRFYVSWFFVFMIELVHKRQYCLDLCLVLYCLSFF